MGVSSILLIIFREQLPTRDTIILSAVTAASESDHPYRDLTFHAQNALIGEKSGVRATLS